MLYKKETSFFECVDIKLFDNMAETESSKLTKPQSQEPVDERGVIVKIREVSSLFMLLK